MEGDGCKFVDHGLETSSSLTVYEFFHDMMATAHPFDITGTTRDYQSTTLDRHGWGFVGVLCVVCTLFLRPSDVVPALKDVAVYQWLIATAILVSYKAIGEHLQFRTIAERPVTACLLMLIAVVAISHLVNGLIWEARASAWMVAKVFALYLLMVSVINTSKRLESFSRWLVLAISTMATLALADRAGWIDLQAFSSINESRLNISRIRGAGIFEDPNDLGLVIVVGIILTFYFLTKSERGWPRYVWILPGILLCATLAQTYSRGAFLALAAAIPAWIYFQKGWRFAALGSVVLLPVIAILFSGRMTDLNSVYEGTGQSRIQIWADTLFLFRQHPFFGIGEGMIFEEIGMVTHNSFLQGFAELGFVGGSLFLGAFLLALIGLVAGKDAPGQSDVDRQLQGAIFSVVVAYVVGMLTLSRQFVAPTFMVLGMAVSTQLIHHVSIPHGWCLGNEFAIRLAFMSVFFLAAIYLATRFLIHLG